MLILIDLFTLCNTRPEELELKVKIININRDKNHAVLSKSHTLYEYSTFIEKVRKYLNLQFSKDEAINKAIHWCIEHGILRDFLKSNGSEVYNMLFEEYSVETALRVCEVERIEKGIKRYRKKGF